MILFISVLLLLLIAMSVFRSPAVALMPDVTIKPLRSKANAVINLMGTAGGILVPGLGIVFSTGSVKNSLMSYVPFFSIISGIMLISLLVFRMKVDEPRFAAEMEEEEKKFGLTTDGAPAETGKKKLSKPEFRSLLLILASVVFWFMGYNAVTSKYSVYAGKVLSMDYNTTLMIANVAAIISYIPVGLLASKIGRKKNDPDRYRLPGSLLPDSLLPAGRQFPHDHECHVCPGGYRLGYHQCEQFSDGCGIIPGRRCRKIYRILLYRQYGCPDSDPLFVRTVDG